MIGEIASSLTQTSNAENAAAKTSNTANGNHHAGVTTIPNIPALTVAIHGGLKARIREAEMKDDIKTLSGIDRMTARITELEAERDSLRKALDDRWAADLKAAKAIFAETGRTHGFPSVKEVVAYYMAEVERLEKEISEEREAYMGICEALGLQASNHAHLDAAAIKADRDSLRAKCERAKEDLENIDQCFEAAYAEGLSDRLSERYCDLGSLEDLIQRRLLPARDYACAVLSELSADAPAQQPQISDEAVEVALTKWYGNGPAK